MADLTARPVYTRHELYWQDEKRSLVCAVSPFDEWHSDNG